MRQARNNMQGIQNMHTKFLGAKMSKKGTSLRSECKAEDDNETDMR
jgi:lambda repressor-like predicted transcriptional regulator